MSAYLRSVGYSSTVTTSREFHAEMVNPLYRHSIPIIMDSLVPNHRKKQLIPESTMEPPANRGQKIECVLLSQQGEDLWFSKFSPKTAPWGSCRRGSTELKFKCIHLFEKQSKCLLNVKCTNAHHPLLIYFHGKIYISYT